MARYDADLTKVRAYQEVPRELDPYWEGMRNRLHAEFPSLSLQQLDGLIVARFRLAFIG